MARPNVCGLSFSQRPYYGNYLVLRRLLRNLVNRGSSSRGNETQELPISTVFHQREFKPVERESLDLDHPLISELSPLL